MQSLVIIAALFWAGSSVLHVVTMLAVSARLRRAKQSMKSRNSAELVTIVRPVHGLDAYADRCLRSSFRLDDSNYELIFCVQSETDPVIPLIERLMAEYPAVRATLLVGDSDFSGNPKLNNMLKSWPAAAGTWLIFADGNIILEPDYIQTLMAAWSEGTGAVSTIHVGTLPGNFWSEIECAFLNAYQARWHMASAIAGSAYVHGKTFMVRREDIARSGGLAALAQDIAEDVAVTRLTRRQGLTVRASYRPVAQPLGLRSAGDVLQRQFRWARLRRESFPAAFVPELLSGGLLPLAAAGVVASALALPLAWTMTAQLLFWYGTEIAFLASAGWHVSWRTAPASVMRDALIPLVWLYAWIGRDFRWGKHQVYRAKPR